MSTLETRNALMEMVETGAVGLLPEYLERLRTEEASIDDQRKALDLMFKAMGIGASEKADTRVVVDIHIENGMVTSASPLTLEMQPSDALLEHAATVVDVIPHTPATPPAAIVEPPDDFSKLLDDIIPIQFKGN
jgi:hypothetical protein